MKAAQIKRACQHNLYYRNYRMKPPYTDDEFRDERGFLEVPESIWENQWCDLEHLIIYR